MEPLIASLWTQYPTKTVNDQSGYQYSARALLLHCWVDIILFFLVLARTFKSSECLVLYFKKPMKVLNKNFKQFRN